MIRRFLLQVDVTYIYINLLGNGSRSRNLGETICRYLDLNLISSLLLSYGIILSY